MPSVIIGFAKSALRDLKEVQAWSRKCAMQTNSPLLTLDRRLRVAAEKTGVQTLEI